MFSKQWKDIKNKKFSPLYLLYGEENFLINETKSLIITEAISSDETDFNLDIYDLEETPVDAAIEDCEIVPFFGDRKVVVMNNPYFLTAEKGKDKVEHNLALLENYVSNPVQTTIAIIVAPYEKLDERKKLTKTLLKNANVLHAKKLTESEIKEWIQRQFLDQQYDVTREAIEKLYLLIGPNLTILHNEISKIRLYKSDDRFVDDTVVDLLVARSLEDNIFALIEQIVHKRLKETLEIYYDLLKQNEDPIKILALVASQFRFIYQVKALMKKGYGQKQIAGVLKVHPYRVKLAGEQMRLFEENQLMGIMNELSELDYKMKTGAGNKEKLLELFFIKLLA